MNLQKNSKNHRHPASFRDPSGFIFRDRNNNLLRQVNSVYKEDYRHLMDSGLYQELVSRELLIEHDEVESDENFDDSAYLFIKPKEVPLISYPYEWSFSALKDAALLTLSIQQTALKYGMSLKDASSFNIQFIGSKAIFIDTLSFEKYSAGKPWVAYGQFCRHFLAPLALMSYIDISMNRLLSVYSDGIPLPLTSKLLPRRSYFNLGLLVHLHLQSRMVKSYSGTSESDAKKVKQGNLSESGLKGIISGLEKTVSKLSLKLKDDNWLDYYQNNSYSEEGFEQKRKLIESYLTRIRPNTVWDLGANTGVFSKIAVDKGAQVFAFDVDPECIEALYRKSSKENSKSLLPLTLDLTNPTPAIGWAHRERESLIERANADLVMSLALIHHLSISNNIPLEMVAQYMSCLGKNLIIEFVPKDDPQVKRLLRLRRDIFDDYTQADFEKVFSQYYQTLESNAVGKDGRVLYLMERV